MTRCKKQYRPPGYALRLLTWFCPDHLLEEIEGDLVQRFHRDITSHGARKARWRFVWSVVRFLRPGIILRNRFSNPLTSRSMISSYFRISMRSLMAHKGNSFINIVGLVTGIASALVIISVIRYELGFDQFHSNADRIFRVVTTIEADGQHRYSAGVPYPLPGALENEIASVESITALHYQRELQIDVLNEDGTILKKFQEPDGCVLIDPSFFTLFDFEGTGFKWIAGNPQTALKEPFSVVLTRSMAEKYFSKIDVLGSTLKVEQQLDFKVTGIVEDFPDNTDFPFTVLLSYSTFYKIQEDEMKNDWRSVANVNQCFVTVPENVNIKEVEKEIGRLYATHVPAEVSEKQQFGLQPLGKIHRDARFGNFNLRTPSDTMLWTLGVAGIVLLLIACINYINLATARSTLRSREIGIRKVLGSRRRQLIFQFLSESFLIATVASIIALFAAELLIQNLAPLINVRLSNYLFADWFVLKSIFIILVVIALLAGFYPAFLVSGFSPLTAIRTRLSSPGRGTTLRRTLVVLQFTVTQVFAIGTFVVLSQIHHFRNVDLGFNKDGVINVNLPQDYKDRLSALQDRLSSMASIASVSVSSTTPSGLRRATWTTDIRRKDAGANEALKCEYQSVDQNYVDLYGMAIIAGRNFSPDDSAGYLIVNETLTAAAGFATAEASVGQKMEMDGNEYTVIGVVKDFHSKSLREDFGSVAFAVHPHMYRIASIKFNLSPYSERSFPFIQSNIDQLESIWASAFPETAFDYRFLDQNIDAYYLQEIRTAKLLQIFSAILLMIGCLGLYGLISFVVNRRLKEVAVRKVFGASMLHIMTLISKDYFKLIIVAFAVAAPVSIYFLERWLDTFVYRIDIKWWIVMVPGLLVLVVALMAIGGLLMRAARANPTIALKYDN